VCFIPPDDQNGPSSARSFELLNKRSDSNHSRKHVVAGHGVFIQPACPISESNCSTPKISHRLSYGLRDMVSCKGLYSQAGHIIERLFYMNNSKKVA
jgi:hypothetical protein